MKDDPKTAYGEGRLEDARRMLLEEYAKKPAHRLIQLDGHNVGKGDVVMRPDEDGHFITGHADVGLYNMAGSFNLPVRVQICEDAPKEEVLKLLDKIRYWVERDYYGLQIMAAGPLDPDPF